MIEQGVEMKVCEMWNHLSPWHRLPAQYGVSNTRSSVTSYIEPLVWLSSEFANNRNGMKEGREKFKSMVVKLNFRHCNLYCIITAWNKHMCFPFRSQIQKMNREKIALRLFRFMCHLLLGRKCSAFERLLVKETGD